MSTFGNGDSVVYRPGSLGTFLSEEGRRLPERMKKVVHGVVAGVDGSDVIINAERPEDSGRFPAALVDRDWSDAFLF